MIIKICGIQNMETLICCEKNKVDFFGMIFYPKSPRNISIENANKLQTGSENLNIKGVGVFVNKNVNNYQFSMYFHDSPTHLVFSSGGNHFFHQNIHNLCS